MKAAQRGHHEFVTCNCVNMITEIQTIEHVSSPCDLFWWSQTKTDLGMLVVLFTQNAQIV